MTLVHGVDIEESNQKRVLVDHARISGTGSNSTEHAGGIAQVIHLGMGCCHTSSILDSAIVTSVPERYVPISCTSVHARYSSRIVDWR